MHVLETTASGKAGCIGMNTGCGWRCTGALMVITSFLGSVSASEAENATAISIVGTVVVMRGGMIVPTAIKRGAVLKDADELRGNSDDSSIQIECPSGASQTLIGHFDAVLNPSNKQTDCAIDLKSGTAVATTTVPTDDAATADASIRGGPIAMTSHHTQFGLTVVAAKPGLNADAEGFVLDGDASCRELASGKEWMIASGNKIQIGVTSKEIVPVDQAKYQQLAMSFARLDVSQQGAMKGDATEKQLQARWLQVMQQPENLVARVELAEAQGTLGIASSHVASYQAKRANVLTTQNGDGALQARAQQLTIPAEEASTKSAIVRSIESTQAEHRPEHAFAFGAAAFSTRSKTFENPTQDGYRVDRCLHWATDCGQPAADAWCKQQGFNAASKFVVAENIGAEAPTVVVGDNKVCSDVGCDGFSSVTCRR